MEIQTEDDKVETYKLHVQTDEKIYEGPTDGTEDDKNYGRAKPGNHTNSCM